jgi:hypothetical protein
VIRTLAFAGYRSLRDLRLSVGRLTVITGGNGTGKSNVYLEAYQRCAQILVRVAEATGTLGDLAVACIYMQRHVLELAIKALIGMLHTVADLDEELARIEKTVLTRAMPPDDERNRSSSSHQSVVGCHDLDHRAREPVGEHVDR